MARSSSPAEVALGAQNQPVPVPVQCRGLCSPIPSQLGTSSGLHSACSSASCMFHRVLCSTVPKFTQQGEKIGRGHLLKHRMAPHPSHRPCLVAQGAGITELQNGSGQRDQPWGHLVPSPCSGRIFQSWSCGCTVGLGPKCRPLLLPPRCRICHSNAPILLPGQELPIDNSAVGGCDFCTTVGRVHEDFPLRHFQMTPRRSTDRAQVRCELLPAVHHDGPWAGCSLQSLLHLGHQVQQGLG